MIPVSTAEPPPTGGISDVSVAARQRVFARVLITISVLAGLLIAANLAVMLWGDNEFSLPESVVGAQSMMLAHDGTFYNSLRDYPYTVNAYMPNFYLLEAGLIRIGSPAFKAGRMISFAALLGIFVVCWRLLVLYSGDRFCAWIGTLMCASTSVVLSWGTAGQVDTLTVFFALTAFYQYSRYRLEHRSGKFSGLTLAGVFVVLGFFTKQTALAAPAAIFVCLLIERPRLANWKVALGFAATVGGVATAGVLGWNLATHGNFLVNTVFANINPYEFRQLQVHLHFLLIGAGQLILVVAICARSAWHGPAKALLIYLSAAMAVLLATAPKIGSDSNYHVEATILLVLCASVGVHAMGYFRHLFRGSRTWITLLHLPLAVHMLLNFRIAVPFLIARVAREQSFRQQVAELKPWVPESGRVISADINAMARLRGRLDIEPLIYNVLVRAGRIDPKPLERDLAAEAFPTVILYSDITKPFEDDPEIPGLPVSQIAEVRKHYKLVRHIPGPYLEGLYVYQPLRTTAESPARGVSQATGENR